MKSQDLLIARSAEPTSAKKPTTKNVPPAVPAIWGRTGAGRSTFHSLLASSPIILAPLTSITTYIVLDTFSGSFTEFFSAVARADRGFLRVCIDHGPRLSVKGIYAVTAWIVWQAVLFMYLPGRQVLGEVTPAGHRLKYTLNGWSAWMLTHVVYFALAWYGWIDAAFIPKNWSSLIAAMNLAGLLAPAAAYLKAYWWPTYEDDRKFSGSVIYDFYMGIELNPRLGRDFDVKFFTNGHLGMMVWTLIDFSNMAYQYQTRGSISLSLTLVTILQVLYVIDFYVNEAWYLGTIDIAHDHYGFYLAWGCFCFLPTTYTIQAQYLGMYESPTSTAYLIVVFIIGLAGYVLFRSVNDQKHALRTLGARCLIWGKLAEYIVAPYTTADGKKRTSLLLCSGWWGWSRHANYVGDLLLSYASCALVGSSKVVVWTYAIWMTVCLVHRCKRDEKRLEVKYGAAWAEYCKRVPWRFVPGVW